jgi:histidyl-tRNA synthetase
MGGSHPGADAEVLMIASETLRAAGVPRPRLVLSWPAVVKAYVEHLMGGGDEARETLALIKDDEFEAVRERCRGRAELLHLGRMIEERGKNAAYLRNLRPLIGVTPAIRAEIDRFLVLADALDAIGIAYEIRFALSRSFEYYSGLQFEVLASGEKKSARDVLAAGGRYDGLIGTLGNLREQVPAVGFAIYLRNAIEHLGGMPEGARVLVGVAKPNPESIKKARKAVAALVKRGVEAELTLEPLARGKREGYALVVEVGEAGERVLYDARAKEQSLKEIVKSAIPASKKPARRGGGKK